VTVARFPPLAATAGERRERALEHLGVLLDLHARGLREPLPLPVPDVGRLPARWAAAARNAWESAWSFPREDQDPEHLLVFGRALKFEELLVSAPRPDEAWEPGESTRFGQLAKRLWTACSPARSWSIGDGATTTGPFDVCGPLPPASPCSRRARARQDRTRSPRSAARYVADGTPLEQLLLVTFTRMATGELRERVRERLVSAEQGPAAARSPARPPGPTRSVQLLATGSREEVEARRHNLARALAGFDGGHDRDDARLLPGGARLPRVAGDVEPDVTFVEDIGDLVEEVVDDLYVRRFHWGGTPDIDRAQAQRIGRLAVDNPTVPIEPLAAPDHTIAAMRRRLAEAVREEVKRRKRHLAVLTYDDLLTRLKEILEGLAGDVAVERLQARFKVVLVDEFQDTGPRCSGTSCGARSRRRHHARADRGPQAGDLRLPRRDVYAYSRRPAAGRAATLDDNWRSDQGLIDAYDALFGGASSGTRRSSTGASARRRKPVRAPFEALPWPLRVRLRVCPPTRLPCS
jgi:exodeoxyribonuclease V beta subunit